MTAILNSEFLIVGIIADSVDEFSVPSALNTPFRPLQMIPVVDGKIEVGLGFTIIASNDGNMVQRKLIM